MTPISIGQLLWIPRPYYGLGMTPISIGQLLWIPFPQERDRNDGEADFCAGC